MTYQYVEGSAPKWFARRDRSRILRRILRRAQGELCALCGRRIPDDDCCSLEHVIPRSLGGMDRLGNFVAAHRDCNHRKADRMPTGCELIWLLAVNNRLNQEPKGI